ncbi:alpha/beta fold hydrolase [Streptomonospora alba]|uniref:alpha/beta fold hydrolase n=1 Tax=Streptomonospora alba TaxID=183763 RepID=UPI00069AD468|nr:alpha/beta hydrolase [Streptomonospora alba]
MTAHLSFTRSTPAELCYREQGSGPTVVLLHGTTASLGVWDPVVELLGGGVRTIALDQRGHGRSAKPAGGYTADHFCADLGALLDELGCDRAVLCGHSLGARNAVVLAAARPERVAGVVAVDYTPYVEPAVLDALESRVRGGDRLFGSAAEVEEYLHDRYPRTPREALRRRIAYGYTRVGGGLQALAAPDAMRQTVQGLRTDFAEAMREVAVPVTLLRGEASRIVSERAFAATRRLRPDLRALEVAEADHYVPEQRPRTVADEITRVLEEAE